MSKRARRCLAAVAAVYRLFGMAHGMGGEMRLAGKYSGRPGDAWSDPYADVVSLAFAPAWSCDLHWTLQHRGRAFGCPPPAG